MTYPQVIHSLSTALPFLNTIGIFALGFYCRSLLLKEFPGRAKINALDNEVGSLAGSISDLSDRFNRFQRKENMRQVRADRTAEQDVLAQAKEIVAEAGSQESADEMPDKLGLYRKVGRSH